MPTRRFRPSLPVDLDLTLRLFSHGPADPCQRREPGGAWWRSLRTPAGPATLRLSRLDGGIEAEAWGSGAAWALEVAPDLCGASDSLEGFAPEGVVAALSRKLSGLRVPRGRAVFQCLVLAILGQKVAGADAWRSYRALCRALGEPAPGPVTLSLPPEPSVVANLPSFELRGMGIDARRGGTLIFAARRARRLEALADGSLEEAHRRLGAYPGIGPWTRAETVRIALGDADAVSVGDYNLPHAVAYNLLGEERGDDAQMLELLEPHRGHRGRVQLLIKYGGRSVPRHAPRRALRRL